MSDPLLIQYRVLSDHRLHFSRLFWQSIAFVLLLQFTSFVIFRNDALILHPIFILSLGASSFAIGFIAQRLWVLEQKYEILLENVENALKEDGQDKIQFSPHSGKTGARFFVVKGLYVMGIFILLIGFGMKIHFALQ